TLALVPVPDPSAYGLVRTDADNAVLGFLEKPSADQIDTNLISAGAYVLERSVVDMIAPDRNVSIEREIWPRLVGSGLYAYAHDDHRRRGARRGRDDRRGQRAQPRDQGLPRHRAGRRRDQVLTPVGCACGRGAARQPPHP